MNAKILFRIAPVTVILLVLFVSLFVLQVVTGISIDEPNSGDLIKWGANVLPLSMGNEPWRLVSSAFLHIGLMHLLFNAFAMYFFGQAAEPMFGHAKFLLIFLLSAIGGNILNNYLGWQSILNAGALPAISAGASGGIMGLGGALLIASVCKMTVGGMRLNLKNLAFVMGINLLYGFAVPGIDNAGHIGGALTGAILGFAIAYPHLTGTTNAPVSPPIAKQSKTSASTISVLTFWVVAFILIIIFGWIWLDIHQQIALHLSEK